MVAIGTDVTGWNASYGQGGGGMISTIGDLLTWADSTCGNSALPPGIAAKRLQLRQIGPGLTYGLGLHSEGAWLGHEGEALGWEAYALKNPDSGVAIAMATNTVPAKLLFCVFIDALWPNTSALFAAAQASTV